MRRARQTVERQEVTEKMGTRQSLIRRVTPVWIKSAVKPVWFRVRYGFAPPPVWSDLSGYERLLDIVIEERLCEIEGDFVEIGAFLGGGTYKLSRLLGSLAPDKRLYSIDVFDPNADLTLSDCGHTMADAYNRQLKGRTQRDVYDSIVRGCTNVITLAQDSKSVDIPSDSIAFAYIDGNHSADYVRSDFYLVWHKLSPGGVVAFDDYASDISHLTQTIHALIGENAGQIERIWRTGIKTMALKRSLQEVTAAI